MNNRYLVFAYSKYCAVGGMSDCKFITNRYTLAINRAKEIKDDEWMDYIYVYDIKNNQIVYNWRR